MITKFMPSIAIILVLLATISAQAAISERRHFYNRLEDTTPTNLLTDIRTGDQLDLGNLQLEGETGDQTLELERFEVFAPTAEVLVHDSSGVKRKLPPKGAYYHGRLVGHPDSIAVITVDETGKTQGLVQLGERIWLLGDNQPDPKHKLRVSNKQLPKNSAAGKLSEPMSCGLDSLQQQQTMITPSIFGPQASEVQTMVAALPTGQLYQATIAIESDGEFYNLFGNSNSATQYIANLFAYATTIYERETQTRLTLGQINLWPDADKDPWTFTTTTNTDPKDPPGGLQAFQTYWNSNKQAVTRSIAHFLSGKALGGGVAYLNALCNNNIGYGLSGSIRGEFSLANPQPIWDIIVVTHEIGHNFNSQHTHDYQNIGGDSNPVDSCYLGGPTGPYSPGYLPGLNSLTGGTAGNGNGTIMSYCHLLRGGYNNISLTFGQSPFNYGIKPYRVSDVMTSFAAQRAASFPNCLPIINNTYLLTVTKTGTGTGTVTSTNPAGMINCGDNCAANFTAGTNTSVTLTAFANSGSTFSGWTGCNTPSGTTCDVTMDASKTVTATFTLQTFQLTVSTTGSGTVTSPNPSGTINCGTDCSYSYISGQTVTLSAVPATGYYFSSWSGACSGSESCIITMDAAKSVTANFTAIPPGYSVLAITKTGLGSVTSLPSGINCGGSSAICNAAFANGTQVTMSAAPVTGYYFVGWSGACSGQGICKLTVYSNLSANANFALIPDNHQLLTVTLIGSGNIASNPGGLNCNTTCSYPFPTGTAVSLIPAASTGQTFTGWSGDWCSGRNDCTVTMAASRTVTATFKNTYLLIMPAINLLLSGE